MIQLLDVKNYGSIVEDLLAAMEKHSRIKWGTKKEISFWYEKIPELRVYHDYVEGKKSLPFKGGKVKFKLRKKLKDIK